MTVWALSTDLRERAVRAFEQGEGSQRAIAERFGISQSTLSRWLKHQAEHKTLEPLRPRGASRVLTPEDELRLVAFLEERNDLTQEELVDRLAEEGISVSRATVGRTLQRLGWTRKKNGVRGRKR